MSYKAIFVNGAFDMTKRTLLTKSERVYFYEPLDNHAINVHRVQEAMVPCRELTYRLMFVLTDGTLIYDLERIAD